jgi:dTDP-4-dehydrorhamnose reductase
VRLVVTGADGMLGHRVVAEAAGRGHDVTGTDLPQLDLTDREATEAALSGERVIHCAAYTKVDDAEAHEDLANRVNGEGSANVARVAAHVVALSTDYVFDGEATEPYTESAEPAPRSAYGRSKLLGERAVLDASPEHAVVRTAWLYGAGGPNFVDTMLRLGRERDEVSVVVDQVGSPTWAGHLAPVLVDLAERGAAGIFHAAGSGQCSWHELAVEAFRVAGLTTPVRETTAAEFVRPAPRPSYSVLATEREDGVRLPPWQDGVKGHLS